MKYAFPDQREGEVRISLWQEDGIQLAIEDTGIGPPKHHLLKKRTSLGLKIVEILTQQLGGTMSITSGEGTRFVLRFENPISRANEISKAAVFLASD